MGGLQLQHSEIEPAWILAMIVTIGGVIGALFKLIMNNGCRCRCFWPNGTHALDVDCEHGLDGSGHRIPRHNYSDSEHKKAEATDYSDATATCVPTKCVSLQ